MSVSEDERARRARLSEDAQQSLEDLDSRIFQAMAAIGVKVDRITSSVVRFHDERGSRPFTTPKVFTSGRDGADMMQVLLGVMGAGGGIDEDATIAALQRDVARMRGLRLMEILNEEWTLDRLDDGQRELLARAMHRLSAHVDGEIAVAVDALMADPSKARAVLNDAPFKHIALAVAKERLAEIQGMEAKAAALPDEVPPPLFTCPICGREFASQGAMNYHLFVDDPCEAPECPCTCETPRERGPEQGGAIDGHEGPCLSRAAAFYEARR